MTPPSLLRALCALTLLTAVSSSGAAAQERRKPVPTFSHGSRAELALSRDTSFTFSDQVALLLAHRPIPVDLTPSLQADLALTGRVGRVAVLTSGGISRSQFSEEAYGRWLGSLTSEQRSRGALGHAGKRRHARPAVTMPDGSDIARAPTANRRTGPVNGPLLRTPRFASLWRHVPDKFSA